jgi:hypothetical protein
VRVCDREACQRSDEGEQRLRMTRFGDQRREVNQGLRECDNGQYRRASEPVDNGGCRRRCRNPQDDGRQPGGIVCERNPQDAVDERLKEIKGRPILTEDVVIQGVSVEI